MRVNGTVPVPGGPVFCVVLCCNAPFTVPLVIAGASNYLYVSEQIPGSWFSFRAVPCLLELDC